MDRSRHGRACTYGSRNCWALVFAVLLVGMVNIPAMGIVMNPPDVTDPQAYIDFGAQFPSVGWIRATDVETGERAFVGSGVLIDPHWVITAAHVVMEARNVPTNGSVRSPIDFSLGSNYLTDPGTTHRADQWFVHPDYVPINPAIVEPDLALLYFEDPITGVTPATRLRGDDSFVRSTSWANPNFVDIVGYGIPGYGSLNFEDPDGYRRAGKIGMDSQFGAATYAWRAPYYIDQMYADASGSFPGNYWYSLEPGQTHELIATATPGDSGGGWFTEMNDEQVLFAISVNGPLNATDHPSWGLRVSPFNDWIDQTMASVPEPTNLAMLVVGVLVLNRKRRR